MKILYSVVLIAAALASVVYGEEVAPYLVQIYHKEAFQCVGTLVSASILVVDKSCVYDIHPYDLVIVAGATSTSEGTKYLARRSSYRINFGVVVLDTPVTEATEFPEICKSSASDDAAVKIVGLVDSEDEKANPTNEVKTTEGAVYTENCSAGSLSFNGKPYKTEACYSVANSQGTCKGAYGSPVLVNDELCGVVSKSAGCNAEGNGIFRDVSDLADAVDDAQYELDFDNEILNGASFRS